MTELRPITVKMSPELLERVETLRLVDGETRTRVMLEALAIGLAELEGQHAADAQIEAQRAAVIGWTRSAELAARVREADADFVRGAFAAVVATIAPEELTRGDDPALFTTWEVADAE